jgi:hypothetical protein
MQWYVQGNMHSLPGAVIQKAALGRTDTGQYQTDLNFQAFLFFTIRWQHPTLG